MTAILRACTTKNGLLCSREETPNDRNDMLVQNVNDCLHESSLYVTANQKG